MRGKEGEVLRENRRFLADREASLRERRLALLRDRAALCPVASPLFFTDDEQVAAARGEEEDALLPEERVRFAVLLARRASLPPIPGQKELSLLFPPETASAEGDEAEDGVIAYLRSSYTDRAYRVFSRVVPEARAVYLTSFAAVCEEVYYNRARWCILPIESNSEGSLHSFRRLIGKYELKLGAVCDIPTSEDGVTRFALLHRNVRVLAGSERYFRFTIALSSSDLPLDELLMAMRSLGLSLDSVQSVPLGYTDRASGFEVTARVGEGDLGAFLAYLCLFAPQFEATGVYPVIVP